MKQGTLEKQYNSVSEEYFVSHNEMNEPSITDFKKYLSKVILYNSQVIVDMGCGPGDMIKYLQDLGHHCIGIDSSEKMVAVAKQQTRADVRVESFSETSIESLFSDVVISKWAMQTAEEIDPIYREVYRILKPGGHFVFLAVHPLRQWVEKKKQGKDYFKKEIVYSEIFDKAITVEEPSHTLMEYFSSYFLSNFSLHVVHEGSEFPAAEQINGDTYPTYLLVVAQKK